MPTKAFDPALASLFHVEWLVAMDDTSADDYARAVAEKAEVLLHSARFIDLQRAGGDADVEVRVWVEAACGSACVSVTYEPGPGLYGFHLLDETLRERLGCVVFDAVPCVGARESLDQADRLLDAALDALAKAQARENAATAWADDMRHARKSVRIPVKDAKVDLNE